MGIVDIRHLARPSMAHYQGTARENTKKRTGAVDY